MQDFVDYIPYIAIALSFLLNLLNMVYTRKKGKSIDSEVSQIMKYRLPSYREKTPAEKQSFSPLVTQYRYNKATDELEELPDKLDVQKLVDSSLQTALEAMFDKFLSPDAQSQAQTFIDDTRDTLDRLTDAMQYVDELKDEFKLDEFASMQDVQKVLEERIESKQKELNDEVVKKAAEAQEQALYAKFKAFMSKQDGDKNE